MNDTTDVAMREGIRELARVGDAVLHPHCSCYSTTDNNGVLYPVFCRTHKLEAMAARVAFGYTTYERAFKRECDARDREHIVKHLMRREDTQAQVVQVGSFWLVLASWGRIKVGGWNQP